MQDYLLVMTKVETLFFRLYPVFKRFPKSEKYSLTARIKEAFYDIICHLATGSSVPSRRFVEYQLADANIKKLKFMLKTAYKQKYFSNSNYEETDLEMTEIAKMVSAMIKTVKKS